MINTHDVTIRRHISQVPYDSMKWLAFQDVMEWLKTQKITPFVDFHMTLRTFNEDLYMEYCFIDPKDAVMFKLTWGGM
jgi:hypothetical protein